MKCSTGQVRLMNEHKRKKWELEQNKLPSRDFPALRSESPIQLKRISIA
jgi:hypothetical protein